MNAVLTLCHNNLDLTKRFTDSIHAQDVPCGVLFVDNGSSDGTAAWIRENTCNFIICSHNEGVSFGWNSGLSKFFEAGASRVFVFGNDTIIPPTFCRTLLSVDAPFVTGVAVDNMEQALQAPAIEPLTPNPDFSAFLIRREAWDKIGAFDERMKHYCSDCDYHIRGHRLGVKMVKAPVPFYHERSSTLRLASPEDRMEIETQANKDRQAFQSIYGCLPGSKEYEAIFL
jgi:GT2 family glycosyltransferase